MGMIISSNNISIHSLGYNILPACNDCSVVCQVAEMHGELMEFNERLQRLLRLREAQVRSQDFFFSYLLIFLHDKYTLFLHSCKLGKTCTSISESIEVF